MTGDLGSSTPTFSAFCFESFDTRLWKWSNPEEKNGESNDGIASKLIPDVKEFITIY